MKSRLAIFLALALVTISPAQAVTKIVVPPLTISAINPNLTINFTGGDQVSQLLTTATNILLVGTIESSTSSLISATALGGSDGFIEALNTHGAKLWDLRLGSSGDDVATSGYVDTLGNIWVAGASATSTSAATPALGFNQIVVWEVSPAGLLENTFTKDLTNVNIPTSIGASGANLIIRGISSLANQPTFTLSLTSLGQFGSVKTGSTIPVKGPLVYSAISSAYNWQSYVAKRPIKGVIGIPLHRSTTVLLKSSLKNQVLKGAYSLQGTPLSVQFRIGIGVLCLSGNSHGYFITIIHTK